MLPGYRVLFNKKMKNGSCLKNFNFFTRRYFLIRQCTTYLLFGKIAFLLFWVLTPRDKNINANLKRAQREGMEECFLKEAFPSVYEWGNVFILESPLPYCYSALAWKTKTAFNFCKSNPGHSKVPQLSIQEEVNWRLGSG